MENNKNRKPYKKKQNKQNLQVAHNFPFNDLETVDYSNDTRRDDLNDVETVDYNNDTSLTDLVSIKKLKQLKKKMMKKMDYRL